jgi:hypothetical protein
VFSPEELPLPLEAPELDSDPLEDGALPELEPVPPKPVSVVAFPAQAATTPIPSIPRAPRTRSIAYLLVRAHRTSRARPARVDLSSEPPHAQTNNDK